MKNVTYMEKIDFEKMPELWAVCQNKECPRAGECLRFQAISAVPERFMSWRCVTPNAWKDGECRGFQKFETVRMARGLNRLYKEVPSRRDRQDIREELVAHFGSNGSYYRYKDGQRLLNPQQQQYILGVLRKYGCQAEDVFDEYADTYDFTRLV